MRAVPVANPFVPGKCHKAVTSSRAAAGAGVVVTDANSAAEKCTEQGRTCDKEKLPTNKVMRSGNEPEETGTNKILTISAAFLKNSAADTGAYSRVRNLIEFTLLNSRLPAL